MALLGVVMGAQADDTDQLCAMKAPNICDCMMRSLNQSSGFSRSSSKVEANASGFRRRPSRRMSR
jgi:hypothetical protein